MHNPERESNNSEEFDLQVPISHARNARNGLVKFVMNELQKNGVCVGDIPEHVLFAGTSKTLSSYVAEYVLRVCNVKATLAVTNSPVCRELFSPTEKTGHTVVIMWWNGRLGWAYDPTYAQVRGAEESDFAIGPVCIEPQEEDSILARLSACLSEKYRVGEEGSTWERELPVYTFLYPINYISEFYAAMLFNITNFRNPHGIDT